jgi:hypothetical protein
MDGCDDDVGKHSFPFVPVRSGNRDVDQFPCTVGERELIFRERINDHDAERSRERNEWAGWMWSRCVGVVSPPHTLARRPASGLGASSVQEFSK